MEPDTRLEYLKIAFRPEAARANLPPLPDIRDESISLQVFTHRSFHARQTHVFEDRPDDPSPDNETLEHLGDSVLNLVVADLLREYFPYLRVGGFAKIRAQVVGNRVLASISLHYRLPDRLRMHPAQVIPLKASVNIQADIFESYVGGLYSDQGLDAVKAWLRPLLRPYLFNAYHDVRAEYGLPPVPESQRSTPNTNIPPNAPINGSRNGWSSPPPNFSVGHLALFNQFLQRESKPVEWVYSDSAGEGTKTTPVWVAKAMVDGKCIGRGRGNTKKGAKNEAAKEWLVKMGVSFVGVACRVIGKQNGCIRLSSSLLPKR